MFFIFSYSLCFYSSLYIHFLDIQFDLCWSVGFYDSMPNGMPLQMFFYPPPFFLNIVDPPTQTILIHLNYDGYWASTHGGLSVTLSANIIHVRGWVWVVTSQSYWAHGGWVQSTWGRVWVKKSNPQERKFIGVGVRSFTRSSFVHGRKRRE